MKGEARFLPNSKPVILVSIKGKNVRKKKERVQKRKFFEENESSAMWKKLAFLSNKNRSI